MALVFTAIEGSSILWEEYSEDMGKAIEMLVDLIEETVKQHNGYQIQSRGDTCQIAFAKIHDAVEWCLDVQLKVLDLNWPENFLKSDLEWLKVEKEEQQQQQSKEGGGSVLFRGPRIAMSLVFGNPLTRFSHYGRTEYYGPIVQRGIELVNVAKGGQIVLNNETWVHITPLIEPYVKADQQPQPQQQQQPQQSPAFYILDKQSKIQIKELGFVSIQGTNPVNIVQLLPAQLGNRKFRAIRVSSESEESIAERLADLEKQQGEMLAILSNIETKASDGQKRSKSLHTRCESLAEEIAGTGGAESKIQLLLNRIEALNKYQDSINQNLEQLKKFQTDAKENISGIHKQMETAVDDVRSKMAMEVDKIQKERNEVLKKLEHVSSQFEDTKKI